MFAERLRAIASRLTGAQLVALVAVDGLPVESHGDREGLDLDALAAELLAQVHTIGENHRELDMGQVHQFSVTTQSHTAMLGRLTQGYFLLLLLDRDASLGRARYELRRAPLAFAEDL